MSDDSYENEDHLKNPKRDLIDELLPLVYDELRKVIEGYFRRNPGHTLQATEAVHEAYLKMMQSGTDILARDRLQFFALAATVIQNILRDHAKRKKTGKRGVDWDAVPLEGVAISLGEDQVYTQRGIAEAGSFRHAILPADQVPLLRRPYCEGIRRFFGHLRENGRQQMGVCSTLAP